MLPEDWKIESIDISSAFTYGDMEHEVHMQLPDGHANLPGLSDLGLVFHRECEFVVFDDNSVAIVMSEIKDCKQVGAQSQEHARHRRSATGSASCHRTFLNSALLACRIISP